MVEVYFETLYKMYYADVFQYALRRVQNEEAAEDIAQETFIEAYKSIEKVKGCTSVKAWLMTVARRIVYHQYQRPENRHTLVPLFDMPDLRQAHDMDAYTQEEFKENLCSILHESDADLIILLYEKGYSVSEAAAQLGISLSACKMRLFRAREKIRKSDYAKKAGYGKTSGDRSGAQREKPGKGNRSR